MQKDLTTYTLFPVKRLLLVLATTGLSGISGWTAFGQRTPMRGTPDKDVALYIQAIYPNPFQDQTRIGFSLSSAETVKITLYNILGSKISTLLHAPLDAGEHGFLFKKTESLPDGIYICTVEAGTVSRSIRMIIRK